ncbi:MAG: DUF4838 domain-containing protein [Ruminococcaceae bacterium]|nr:DUF4838 domain-containing protein [Oscillospiraceae bacterium]
MKQRIWNVITEDSPTIRFAAEEFARIMKKMDPASTVVIYDNNNLPSGDILYIGKAAFSEIEDPIIDDGIRIDIKSCSGKIVGVNDRSVLIAVYRFFREAGCVFVRPGRAGEFTPETDSSQICVTLSETPAYRHRGLCLEGSNCYENVVDMIDWAPKLGFNEFFTQLFRPAWTFRRWYEHYSNPEFTPTPVSLDTIDSFVQDFDREIALRGLQHQRIGHGWGSKILGMISGAWHEQNRDDEVIPGREKLIATIDGKKCLFKGSGIDTNLCYSDPEVQQLLVDEVVTYAKENPTVQYVHFWFADTLNNQCECSHCATARPSDHYVKILNMIDDRLTREGLETKIVFLIYLDLLWEPEKEVLNNQDRFVLLYAPIRRSYSVPLASDSGKKEPPFKRNGFVPTPGAGDTLPYLHSWQKLFHGDSFIFDYHYMWDYINDPGCYKSVQIMAQDVEDFRSLGLNGMMSCQNMRVFMPNGLGMNIMGQALWSGKNGFNANSDSYFYACYGKDGEKVKPFLATLSELYDPTVLRGETPVRNPKNAANYAKIPLLIDSFLPTIKENLNTSDEVWKRSWECLLFYTELCRKTARVLLLAATGKNEEMDPAWADARSFACKNEMRFQKEFDVFEFILVWESKILNRIKEQEEAFIE